jgi:hypothetical protein
LPIPVVHSEEFYVKASISTSADRRLRAARPSLADASAVKKYGMTGLLLLAAGAGWAQETPSMRPPAPTAGTALLTLEARYDSARVEYGVGHFQSAFAEFAALADAGHCGAARMALQMLRYGKALYATEFRTPLERVQQWQHLPACAAIARR